MTVTDALVRRGHRFGAMLLLLAAVALPACNGRNLPNAGQALGEGRGAEPGVPSPGGGLAVPAGDGSRVIGASCHRDDPTHICLAVKYVVFRDSTGAPAVSQRDAVSNIAAVNAIWKACDIGFQIEEYEPVYSADYELRYGIADFGELDDIREAFGGESTLLLATTGAWDRKGSLGSSAANAWTSMPGGPPYGVVLERPVGSFAALIAHEIGHYLNLFHLSDRSDLMNAIIYSGSTGLYASQCETARSAAAYYWAKMHR